MLPLLISVLPMPISPGPSAMPVIMVVVLAMFSPVQAIIAAEAGVNARAENIAVVIKILIRTLPENETSLSLANEYAFVGQSVSNGTNFCVLRCNGTWCRAIS